MNGIMQERLQGIDKIYTTKSNYHLGQVDHNASLISSIFFNNAGDPYKTVLLMTVVLIIYSVS